MQFTDVFGDTPRARLLDFLADHPASDYPVTEMAERAGMSRPTVYAQLEDLERTGLVRKTRTLGRSRLYAIAMDHPVVRAVLRSDLSAARDEAEPLLHR